MAVEDLERDDVGVGRHAAVLRAGLAALVGRPRHRAVAGDQAVDERAVAAVVVHVALPVDEVDESDDPRLSVDAVQVGHVGAAAVEDRDSNPGAVEAALGRRRDGAETDGGVGHVETVCVVGAEGGHVGCDVVDVRQRGDVVERVGGDVGRDGADQRQGVVHRRGIDLRSQVTEVAGTRIDDHRDAAAAGGGERGQDARINGCGALIGSCRPAQAEGHGEQQDCRRHNISGFHRTASVTR